MTQQRETGWPGQRAWEVMAHYDGNKLTTVLNHYVRAGEDVFRDSVSNLGAR